MPVGKQGEREYRQNQQPGSFLSQPHGIIRTSVRKPIPTIASAGGAGSFTVESDARSFVERAHQLGPVFLSLARQIETATECYTRLMRDVDNAFDDDDEDAYDALLEQLDTLAIFEPLAFIAARTRRALDGSESRWNPQSYDELETTMALHRFTGLGRRPTVE